MRWYLASAIGLWFILISLGSALPSRDKCSSIMAKFPSVSTGLSFAVPVKDIITMLTDCYCEINTDLLAVCLLYSCLPCPSGSGSSSGLCFCSNASLNIDSSCLTTYFNQDNQPGSKKYSCQTLTPSNGCSIGSDAADSVLELQLKVIGISGVLEQVFRVICSARSVTPDASNTTVTPVSTTATSNTTVTPVSTTAASSTTVTSTSRNHLSATTDKSEYKPDIASTPTRETITDIGVGVGVGGGVLLIIVIVIIIVVLRRRRSESNKLDACALSQTTGTAVIPSETAYESYTTPVSAAYDNATNGTTSNYESIAYNNVEVGESNHAYTEIKEIGDLNGYDNSETGRSDAYSMCKETGEDYDKVSENQSENIENETTVIDTEFYG